MPNLMSSIRAELARLLSLMLPILLTQFSLAGLGLIDTLMAGAMSVDDLAAIGVGVGLWLPVMLLVSGIMISTVPLISEARGANQWHKIASITRQSLWLGLLIGLAALVLLQFTPLLLPIFNVDPDTIPKASLYLQSIGFGMPAVTMYAALRGYCEALGQPTAVTVISLLALVVLIPLNLIFMYGFGPIPAFGSAGCGIATAILQWLMLLTLALYTFNAKAFKSTPVFDQFEKINFALLKKLWQLGFPIGLAIFFEVSVFSLGAIIVSPLGEIATASHQIAISITSVLFMIPLSMAMAITICVGIHYGAKDWQFMRLIQWLGFGLVTFFAAITMLILWLAREPLILQYNQHAEVVALAAHLLVYAIIYQLMDAWQVTAAGALRGMQDTKTPMLITFIAYWIFALPVGVILTRHSDFGAAGIWIGLLVGLSVACVLLLARLHYNNKRLATIIKS